MKYNIIESQLQQIFGNPPDSSCISIKNGLQELFGAPVKEIDINLKYFLLGSSVICKNRKEFNQKISTAYLYQDRAIIRKLYSHKAAISYKCHFSFIHLKDNLFSESAPDALCQFRMVGKSVRKTEDSEEFRLTKLKPYHNHSPMPDGSKKTGELENIRPQNNKEDPLEGAIKYSNIFSFNEKIQELGILQKIL